MRARPQLRQLVGEVRAGGPGHRRTQRDRPRRTGRHQRGEVRLRRGDDEQHQHAADRRTAESWRTCWPRSPTRSGRLAGVGHRVVHGGSGSPRRSSSTTRSWPPCAALVDLAPLHMPANLAGIEAARASCPHLPQVAVFDTAFHQTMPPVAYRYAVPTEWYEKHHVRRYGFHGTSHRYVSGRAAELLGRPLDSCAMVTLHLGNGCSAAAVRDGESVDTTMGLTPLEGLVMGTRSGDVDPGAARLRRRPPRPGPGRRARRAQHPQRVARAVRREQRHAHARRRGRARARPTRRWPSRSSATARRKRSVRWRWRSAGSMRWSSPAASASGTTRCAAAILGHLGLLGLHEDPRRQRRPRALAPADGSAGRRRPRRPRRPDRRGAAHRPGHP